MASMWFDFLALRGYLKFDLYIPYEKYQQSRLKSAYMVDYYSCWTYTNNQANFIEI